MLGRVGYVFLVLVAYALGPVFGLDSPDTVIKCKSTP